MKMNPVYSNTNLDKSLPVVPTVTGKFSFFDWVVMGGGAVLMLVLCLCALVFFWEQVLILVVLGIIFVGPQNVVMFFRRMSAPQRNPFSVE